VSRIKRVLPKGSGSELNYERHGWHLLREDLSLPAAVLYQSRLENNLQWMRRFTRQQQVQLAPHGKTTMAPALFARQLAAGAWGVTLATATQVAAAYTHGVRRVLMANQLVGKRNMEIIGELLVRNDLDFYCLVDSIDNVRQLGDFFVARGLELQVLLEIGMPGGRCGCRTWEEVAQLVAVIAQYPALSFAGIETYEGVIHGENAEQRIRAHLSKVKDIFQRLLAQNAFDVSQALLTGAGSAWYDVVAESFGAEQDARILPVIRPGCYLIHDHGLCRSAQENIMLRSTAAAQTGGDLQSSLEIWAYVQSIPEPGYAIVGMGKRDVAFDAGLPIPVLHYRPGSETPLNASREWIVQSMMDQHAAMTFPVGDDVKVGDVIAFATSHPCLTFDKWQQMYVIDDNYVVIEVIHTCF
jgi:D-serine dehydratase